MDCSAHSHSTMQVAERRPSPSAGYRRRDVLRILGFGSVAAVVPTLFSGCFRGAEGSDGNGFESSRIISETDRVESLAESIVQETRTHEEAVHKIVEWTERNFFHYYQESDALNFPSQIYAAHEENANGLQEISIEDLFRERAVGCHYASAVMIVMLRSIGIFAEYLREDGHGIMHIPELDRFVHGDHVADLVGIPATDIALTRKELSYWQSHPGWRAEDLGLDPSLGMINHGFYALEEALHLKHRYLAELHRDAERQLYIFASLENGGTPDDFRTLSNLCPDYGLTLGSKLDDGVTEIVSQRVPIQTLTKK